MIQLIEELLRIAVENALSAMIVDVKRRIPVKNKKIKTAALILIAVLFSASFFVAHGLTKTGGMIDAIASATPSVPKTQTPPPVKPVTLPLPVPTTPTPVETLPASKESAQELIVFGKPVDLGGAPIILTTDGKSLLPLRKLGEAMGYTVTWDNVIKAAVLEKGTESILIKPDSRDYTWGPLLRVLSSKPIIAENRLYMPLDFITGNPDYLLNNTATVITIDRAGVEVKKVLTGEIEEVTGYTNGLGLKVKDNKKTEVQLYVTDTTRITHYSTGDMIQRSLLQAGTKAIFSYTEVSDEKQSTYNILSNVEVVELSTVPASKDDEDDDEDDDDEDDD